MLSDNYLLSGVDLSKLTKIAENYPLVFHSTALNIASPDPLDKDYLSSLKKLCKTFGGQFISDHLCWNALRANWHHELLPFPFTEELLDIVSLKIDQIQHELDVPFVLENVSSYLQFSQSEMNEAEFIAALCHKTDCSLLLDVNNVLVNERNLGPKASEFLKTISQCKISQIHIAGSREEEGLLIDDHASSPSEDCLQLLKETYSQFGLVPTCLEWDADLPGYEVILLELEKITKIYQACDYALV